MQRNATLHTDNTVVDNSSGADIRALVTSWTTYAITACATNNQGTNSERRWDPETGSETTVLNASTSQDGKGFAVPTADMATVGAACVPSLAAQNLTVDFSVNFFGSGTGAAGANDVWTPRCSIWKWNTSANTATLIVGGSGSTVSNTALFAYGPVLKAGQVVLAVPATTFGTDEVLLLVACGNLACGAGALGGARSFAVRLNQAASPITLTFASTGLRQSCTNSTDMTGDGVPTRVCDVSMDDSLVGDGVSTESRLVTAAKSFDLTGDGVMSSSKLTTAAKSFDLTGDGVVTRDGMALGVPRSIVGDGTADMSRLVTAAKSFDLTGDGVVTRVMDLALSRDALGDDELTFAKPLTAARSFDVVGDGVLTGTITIPIDEVPEGGGGTTIRRPIYLFDD